MSYYLILWNQVDILQQHFKMDAPLNEALRYNALLALS